MVPARTLKSTGLALACLLAITGCGPAGPTPEQAAAKARQAAAFTQSERAWRDTRLANLTKADGWTSLIGLHWLDPGTHRVGSGVDNGIRLAMGPEHLGVFTVRGDKVDFKADTEVTIDDQPGRGGALRTDMADAGPSKIGFDGDKGVATVIVRGGRLALRVKHADAETRTKFAGLQYWPGGADWKIAARFVPHEAGRTMPIPDIIGNTQEIANPGALEFQRDGKAYRIEALDEGEGSLFLVFADRTSGHGSYPAGRFIDAPMPDAKGNVLIDFNQAYNPPCAFTSFATCPLPPPENRLDLAIEAGEKTYAKPH